MSSYWEERQKETQRSWEDEEEKLRERLSKQYKLQSAAIEKDIAAYFSKYGENNVIEYRKLLTKLSDSDRMLLMRQMDQFAKDYPEYAYLMPVRESIYNLDRLQGLQTSINMQMLELGAEENKLLEAHLLKNGLNVANASAEALGFGKNFYAYNKDILKKFVGTNWSNGKNFSERIWENTNKLSNYLNNDIAQAFARGDSYDKIRQNLLTRFNTVAKNDMNRLIFTEGTYVFAEASMTPFEEDFKEYEISTADSRACSLCQSFLGKVFTIEDRKAGTNFPPFHPWCRCTFTIHVDDWNKWMDDYVKKHSQSSSNARERAQNIFKALMDERPKRKRRQYMVEPINTIKEVEPYLNQLYFLGSEREKLKEFIANEMRYIPLRDLEPLKRKMIPIYITEGNSSYLGRGGYFGVIRINKSFNPGAFAHEYAHVLTKKLNKKPGLMKCIDNVVDKKIEISYLEVRDTEYVAVKSNMFVSAYQGRTYIKKDNYDPTKNIDLCCELYEYPSVGYQTFVLNPELLKEKDEMLYEYFKNGGIVE